MKAIHLTYIIPLSIIIGFIFGFQAVIPDNITIDVGENYVRSVDLLGNISIRFAQNCSGSYPTSKEVGYYIGNNTFYYENRCCYPDETNCSFGCIYPIGTYKKGVGDEIK